eukprot:14423236-Heterocapsa_arctica.AAC.1
MSSRVRPGFQVSGPSVAHIPASLRQSTASVLDVRATQLLIATARGRGRVTSTPTMLSVGGLLPPLLLLLAARWTKEI